MPNSISGQEGEIAYINNLTAENLVAWAKRVLAEGNTSPILRDGHTEPDEILLHLGSTAEVGEKIKEAIFILVSSWDSAQGTAYLSELLYQVGMLNITEAHPFILSWLQDESLKGTKGLKARAFFLDEDAHVSCWRTMGGCHMQYPILETMALRDISDSRYFFVCFRVLREKNSDYLICFFPNFIRVCQKKSDPYVTFNNEFFDINKDFGPEFFRRFPEEIGRFLGKKDKKFFYEVLAKVRYELNRG